MDDSTVDFYNLHAAEQAALYETADMSAMYHRLADILPFHGTILEIGCGSGRDARALADMGFSVVATDASLGMLREAERHAESNFSNLSFIHLPFPIPYNHPFLEKKFDLVLSVAVLMHLTPEDRKKTLAQVSQLLKPMGYFYCSFKNQTGVDKRLYQHIEIAELIAECCNVGLKNCLEEFGQDVLGRNAVWMTMIFQKVF